MFFILILSVGSVGFVDGEGIGAELGGAEGPITVNAIQSIPWPRQISVK